MYQIDNATAAAGQPASTPAGDAGYFTDGNPVTGIPATIVPAEWLNSVMMELLSILSAAGVVPEKNQFNQIISALDAMHSPVVGTVRNGRMILATSSASATYTADLITVATALNGRTYRLPSFSKTINLSTTGAGGMDTGSAPASGFVALYAIYNPATGASAMLATNATSALQGEVYGGGSMPAGYTASALVGVYPTNASGQLLFGALIDRETFFSAINVVSNGTATSYTSVALSAAVPINARSFGGNITAQPGTAPNGVFFAADANGTALQAVSSPTTNVATSAPYHLPILTPRTAYYYNTVGSSVAVITVTSFKV